MTVSFGTLNDVDDVVGPIACGTDGVMALLLNGGTVTAVLECSPIGADMWAAVEDGSFTDSAQRALMAGFSYRVKCTASSSADMSVVLSTNWLASL